MRSVTANLYPDVLRLHTSLHSEAMKHEACTTLSVTASYRTKHIGSTLEAYWVDAGNDDIHTIDNIFTSALFSFIHNIHISSCLSGDSRK